MRQIYFVVSRTSNRVPDLWKKGHYGRKGQVKPPETVLSLLYKIVNQRYYCIPGRLVDIIATIKDIKDSR